ncbi:MAG: lipoyl(octanoyl) transferase [Omnitrophica WOR_2 bacterium GWF2_43_52]|nr:MAG: lipoyl(octanoyl) transferase [Omnitrophica WOR_2 bacterium GWA2_44_7]OGX17631.1 MAG: lipoyl(octanoyl) transferase [Omnitrophica WOR_2 bacterium GWC2_44_8]OGX21817.1 MAG: lipoyl(octanoyl) transferase [Omnitrophica WOR_2 bacterium GWF2_43_52]OGX56530.1 MAG: lipoyl(octanoyl) transferase [Omnitrophica WOR_2 bacterium RIFOXYC2_FULL_43_9]HAH21669.1 octanoyltransferase [Candidatus Omnitrophota bacterium]
MDIVVSAIAKENTAREVFNFEVMDLGAIGYQECFLLQKNLLQEIYAARRKSTLLLCEHPPVITSGRLAKRENILRPLDEVKAQGIEIAYSDRGGDVTLHMPGQLIAYPLFDLRLLQKDIHRYLRNLEETAILLLKEYGIHGQRKAGLTGVWVNERKIASIGIAISHWVTYHGMSLNVNGDMGLFSLIRPCGQDIMVTSMQQLKKQQVLKMDEVKERLAAAFTSVFSKEDNYA